MNQLDAIKNLKLDELKLSGNPVCSKYKDRNEDYVRYCYFYLNANNYRG